ncbi:MAG: glycosyltransferase family 4 protein [Clostridia bacterium]|nr:glycosyltransferase family 4 protein [Clostridia bacterium]
MKKIGFVTPWFGENIPGGAEMELRGLATHLHAAGAPVEILTTCVPQFSADWSKNELPAGRTTVCGLPVRRFRVRRRDARAFDAVNLQLMRGACPDAQGEAVFLREMINSPALYRYMRRHSGDYALFVFIPYMFGTTYFGCGVAPERSVLIPCMHDESYAYMQAFRERFSSIAGMIFLAAPEEALARRVYDLSALRAETLGAGLDTAIAGDAARFQKKYHIDAPFLLYAGRKDKGKNVDTLLACFARYKAERPAALQLVLIGGGSIDIPASVRADVRDLGFVDAQDKYDAYAAALCLCQPSHNESFSLVIMESWLCGRPVLVSDACAVTRHFACDAQGGLYFADYPDFAGCVDYFLSHGDACRQMGENGRAYVLSRFSWDVIVKKYMDFFAACAEGRVRP